ncbi:hypothetical protein RFI_32510, partial [Reticulomyxa filosa]
ITHEKKECYLNFLKLTCCYSTVRLVIIIHLIFKVRNSVMFKNDYFFCVEKKAFFVGIGNYVNKLMVPQLFSVSIKDIHFKVFYNRCCIYFFVVKKNYVFFFYFLELRIREAVKKNYNNLQTAILYKRKEKFFNNAFQNFTELPKPSEALQCLSFKDQILLCGGFETSNCYSYHTIKNRYKYISSYPNVIELYGHCVVQLTHLQADSNEINVLLGKNKIN